MRCQYCGRRVRAATYVGLTSRHLDIMVPLCSTCYEERRFYVCSNCNASFLFNPSILGDRHYCQSCFEELVGRCSCFIIARRHHAYYVGERPYCRLCRSPIEPRRPADPHLRDTPTSRRVVPNRERRLLRPYTYKPTPRFHGEGAVFYGVELETDRFGSRYEALENLHKIDRREEDFYLKSDASLRNGIEIVFHPRTIDSWREYDLSPILRVVRDHGGQASSTCGLHVHRSRGDLSKVTISKLLAFFSICRRQITSVAGRETRYAHFRDLDKDARGHFKRLGRYALDRYQAINIQPMDTIEFRVFRSVLKQATIKVNLLFLDYLVDFVKSILVSELTHNVWDDFVGYIKIRKTKGGCELLDYLEKLNLA